MGLLLVRDRDGRRPNYNVGERQPDRLSTDRALTFLLISFQEVISWTVCSVRNTGKRSLVRYLDKRYLADRNIRLICENNINNIHYQN
jgi:hypothetical protein